MVSGYGHKRNFAGGLFGIVKKGIPLVAVQTITHKVSHDRKKGGIRMSLPTFMQNLTEFWGKVGISKPQKGEGGIGRAFEKRQKVLT
jgi:hypothetical protein